MSAFVLRRTANAAKKGSFSSLSARSLHSATRPSQTLSPARQSSRSLATALSPVTAGVPKTSVFAPLDSFTRRHVGPQPSSVNTMLEYLGFQSMDEFIAQCVPPSIRIAEDAVAEVGPNAIAALSEQELLRRAKELGSKNQVFRSFIGMGYHQAVSCQELGVRGKKRS